MTTKISAVLGLTLALTCFPAAVSAAATTIDASDNGFYANNGLHFPTSTNTFTGDLPSFGELRSFYVFDITGSVPITSASITFLGRNGTFSTDTGSETANFYDYVGSITALVAGTGGTPTFDDLGTGSNLGSFTLTAANGSAMPEFTVSLGSTFISQFNSAIGSPDSRIAVGAALQNLIVGGAQEAFWSGSEALPAARLNLESSVSPVPEPSTWAMMLIGFGLTGASMRRVRRKQKAGVTYA